MKPTKITLSVPEINRGIEALQALGGAGIRVKGYSNYIGLTLHNLRYAMQKIHDLVEEIKLNYSVKDVDGRPIPICKDQPLPFDRFRGHYNADREYEKDDIVLESSKYYEKISDKDGGEPSKDRKVWRYFGEASQVAYQKDMFALHDAIDEINQTELEVNVHLIPKKVFDDLDEKEPKYTSVMTWPYIWQETHDEDSEMIDAIAGLAERLMKDTEECVECDD